MLAYLALGLAAGSDGSTESGAHMADPAIPGARSLRLVVAFALRLRAGRRTNLALLALLAAAVVTGSLAFAIGGRWVLWAVVTHGVAGLGFVALAPWKSAISARGARRHRPGISLSFALAASIVVTIVTGVGHSTGLLVSLGLVSAMQLHVSAAVASMPLAVWHVLARKTVPHRTDFSRRNLLRGGVLSGGRPPATSRSRLCCWWAGFRARRAGPRAHTSVDRSSPMRCRSRNG